MLGATVLAVGAGVELEPPPKTWVINTKAITMIANPPTITKSSERLLEEGEASAVVAVACGGDFGAGCGGSVISSVAPCAGATVRGRGARGAGGRVAAGVAGGGALLGAAGGTAGAGFGAPGIAPVGCFAALVAAVAPAAAPGTAPVTGLAAAGTAPGAAPLTGLAARRQSSR